MSVSIQGKAFSWPTAISTSSHSIVTSGSPVGDEHAAPALVLFRLHFFEHDAGEASRLMGEGLGGEEVHDRDAFAHRVFLFPWRGLHLREAGAHDDLDFGAAEAPRRPAAIHRRVAAAEHHDAPADRRDMAERHAGEPIDADMDVA